ncbi:hypothetical protein [Alloprevotella sp. OH1205_COT-284]|nr:hypothetical protein [Alloprevotella sp. OH1205_COT-284]
MNKFFKFLLGAVVIVASTLSFTSCNDQEDTEPVQVHNGGAGK